MPNAVKGSDIKRLLWYLAGPGRANEHTNPQVIAGDFVTMSVYAGRIDQKLAWEMGRLLDSPRQTLLRGEPVLTTSYKQARALMAGGMSKAAAFEAATRDENTWHCSLALRRQEGELPMEKWAEIATDFMREMGFVDRADGVPDVRWAVIHHGLSKNGNDHVHIAMPVVRPDGSLADMFRDRPRAQAAARTLEARHGLEVLYTREHGDTERATTPAERARAERTGAPETDREALRRRVRGAALAAESEAEWLRMLRTDGVTVIPRWEPGGLEVGGYAVRMPPKKNLETGRWERSLSYGGLRLGKDLTLPALRSWAPWDQSAAAQAAALAEWQRVGANTPGRGVGPDPVAERDVVADLRQVSARLARIPVEDRAEWARAASRVSGVFAAASVRTEQSPGPLDRLSRQLARAGQLPSHQRTPPSRTPETTLRAVARMFWIAANPQAMEMGLLYSLTELLLTVREMLAATDRAAAAAAMASEARKALTEIHMRRDGIDPARRYRREEGSPAWAAAMRASIVVDGLDRDDTERDIDSAHRAWETRRIARIAHPGEQYDEKGHILTPPRRDRSRAADPQSAPDYAALERFMRLQKPTGRPSSPVQKGIAHELDTTYGSTEPQAPTRPAPTHDDRGRDAERQHQPHRPPPERGPDRDRGRDRGR